MRQVLRNASKISLGVRTVVAPRRFSSVESTTTTAADEDAACLAPLQRANSTNPAVQLLVAQYESVRDDAVKGTLARIDHYLLTKQLPIQTAPSQEPLVQFTKHLVERYYDSLRGVPWLQFHSPPISFIQFILNDATQFYLEPVAQSTQMSQLGDVASEAAERFQTLQLAQLLHNLLLLGLPKSHRLVRQFFDRIQSKELILNANDRFLLFGEVGKINRLMGTRASEEIRLVIQQLSDNVKMLSSKRSSSNLNLQDITALLSILSSRMALNNHDELAIGRLALGFLKQKCGNERLTPRFFSLLFAWMAQYRGASLNSLLDSVQLSRRQLLDYVYAGLQPLASSLSDVEIAEVVSELKRAHCYPGKLRADLSTRALLLCSGSPGQQKLDIRLLSNSFYALDHTCDPHLVRFFADKIADHLDNADVLLVSNIAENLQYVQRVVDSEFRELFLGHIERLSHGIISHMTRLGRVLQFLESIPPMDIPPVFNARFCTALIEQLQKHESRRLPCQMIFPFLIANFAQQMPHELYQRLLAIIPQFKLAALEKLLHAIRIAPVTSTSLSSSSSSSFSTPRSSTDHLNNAGRSNSWRSANLAANTSRPYYNNPQKVRPTYSSRSSYDSSQHQLKQVRLAVYRRVSELVESKQLSQDESKALSIGQLFRTARILLKSPSTPTTSNNNNTLQTSGGLSPFANVMESLARALDVVSPTHAYQLADLILAGAYYNELMLQRLEDFVTRSRFSIVSSASLLVNHRESAQQSATLSSQHQSLELPLLLHIVRAMAAVGYEPCDPTLFGQTVADVVLQQTRDSASLQQASISSHNSAILSTLRIGHSLALMRCFPPRLLGHIFSPVFLGQVDELLAETAGNLKEERRMTNKGTQASRQSNPHRGVRDLTNTASTSSTMSSLHDHIRETLMKLNRAVVLECNELQPVTDHIPWFHQAYRAPPNPDQLQLQQSGWGFKNEVQSVIEQIVADRNDFYLLTDQTTQFFHWIDFELVPTSSSSSSSKSDAEAVGDNDKAAEKTLPIAVLLLSYRQFVSSAATCLANRSQNSPQVKLRGSVKQVIRQLEILGYRVVTLSPSDWASFHQQQQQQQQQQSDQLLNVNSSSNEFDQYHGHRANWHVYSKLAKLVFDSTNNNESKTKKRSNFYNRFKRND